MRYYKWVYPFYKKAAQSICKDCKGYLKPGLKILDLGCGSGIVTKEFAEEFHARITGVDIVDNRIFPINFRLVNGRDLPFADDNFDAVLITYVLHHADDPIRVLCEAKRVLKKGGRVIIAEDLYEGALAKAICWVHGESYGVLFEHHGGKEHHEFKSARDWRKIFKELDLKIICEQRLSSVFNPVHKHLFIIEK